MSGFTEDQLSRIAKARGEMSVTHDADRKTLLVTMPARAWMLFSYVGELHWEVSSSNVQYDSMITGVENTTWFQTNAAWEVAQESLARLGTIPPAVHKPESTTRITVGVARYLAMLDRVNKWGGFVDESAHPPGLLSQLSVQERSAVDDRLRGKVVL